VALAARGLVAQGSSDGAWTRATGSGN
jgi:hypothetical protein